MIQNSKQRWQPGQQVRVGFMTLTVRAAVATPGDYAPDAYILANSVGTQLYRFVPHRGVEKISVIEAQAMLAEQEEAATHATNRALAKAQADARAIAAINHLLVA